MKRFVMVALFSISGLAACGDDDGDTTADAAPAAKCDEVGGAACFELPSVEAKAVIGGVEGPANWACDAPTITTSTIANTVSGLVEDFQTGDPVDTATVEVFAGLDFSAPIAMATGDANGAYSVNIPMGLAKSRMNWRMTAAGQLPTYALNADLDVTNPAVTGYNRGSVSEATANALPAFIGVIRTDGRGVLAGVAVDCDGNNVSNVIATVASASSAGDVAPTFVDSALVFYFSNGDPDLPVRRTSRIVTNKDGLFVIIEIPPTGAGQTYFLQTWGFKTAADVSMGMAGLSLLSEIEAPVVGDSVISVEMTPNQGQ